MSDDTEQVADAVDEYANLLAMPYRLQFNYTGAFLKEGDNSDVAEMIEAVIADAEKRGLFFEYNFAAPMEPGDVDAGSPLEEVITGIAARRG